MLYGVQQAAEAHHVDAGWWTAAVMSFRPVDSVPGVRCDLASLAAFWVFWTELQASKPTNEMHQ